MRILSTTLTGNNEDIVGDALRSVVDWVDACLVIDTGVTDGSLDVARQIAGEKLIVERFSWVNDFAAARNFALDAAERHGATWAVTVDTDERILLLGEDLRATLASLSVGVLLLPDEAARYTKERIFRLPSPVRFVGPTHESFAAYQLGSAIAEKARFRELPKDAALGQQKFERDVAILAAYVKDHPDEPRWHYYLGETLKNLGRLPEAVEAYRSCTALRGWDEESAWACYRAAQCFEELEQWQEMLDVLALGIGRHAGLGELPWYASFASLKLGNNHQAIYWARLAITWGLFAGHGKRVPRIGFRYLPGLFEGPFQVLSLALKNTGDLQMAAEAGKAFEQARAARVAYETAYT